MVEKRAFATRLGAAAQGQETDQRHGVRSISPLTRSTQPSAPRNAKFLLCRRARKGAEAGVAMPDGSYPIKPAEDVENGVRDYGRQRPKQDVKARVIARAKAMGAESELPDSWTKTRRNPLPRSLRQPRRRNVRGAGEGRRGAGGGRTQARTHGRRERASEGARRCLSRARRIDGPRRGSKPSRCRPGLRCAQSRKARTAPRAMVGADEAIRRLAALPAPRAGAALTKLSLANPAPPLSFPPATFSRLSWPDGPRPPDCSPRA